jgi:hypothetical protein
MGALPVLLRMIAAAANSLSPPPPPPIMRIASWTLSNMFRGNPGPQLQMVTPALPMVAALLRHPDTEVVVNALWAVSFATAGGDDRVQAVLDTPNLFQSVVEWLSSADATKQLPALRSVGSVLTGSNSHAQVVLDMGALPRLVALLVSNKHTLQKESCWALSNIAAGTHEQIGMLIASGALPLVREIVKSSDLDLRTEAAWVLANSCTHGTEDQIRSLVETHGVIYPLCYVMSLQDVKLLKTIRDALESILRVGAQSGGPNQYAMQIEKAGGGGGAILSHQ